MILFAAYMAAETPNVFKWAGQPPKLSIAVGISTPSNAWFLEPPKRCSNQFRYF